MINDSCRDRTLYHLKYTDCVVVCPVDCFYEGDQILFINPNECTDCDVCVPECPTEAIFYEDNVPEKWQDYIALNAEMAPQYSKICEKKPSGPWRDPLDSQVTPKATNSGLFHIVEHLKTASSACSRRNFRYVA
ncbi:MAG: ferredoxin family protein [Planctomycetaceae bacterium]